jgi:bacterioferritin-associated ferredoxin
MYACICHDITEQQVREKAQHNAFTFARYCMQCKNNCCKCLPRIKELVDEATKAKAESAAYYEAAYGGGID